MGYFKFICPFCNQHMECEDTMDGQMAKCPSCGEEIVPVREETEQPDKPEKELSSPQKPENPAEEIKNAPERGKSIRTSCPHCGSRFDADAQYAGQRIECSSCGMYFVIEEERKTLPKQILRPVPKEENGSLEFPGADGKKDLIFFWVGFSIIYFCVVVALIGAHNAKDQPLALLLQFGWVFLGSFLTSAVVKAETGLKEKWKIVLYSMLIVFLFPIGFIVYADVRKKCGLSNIMPWAIISAIITGTALIFDYGVAYL